MNKRHDAVFQWLLLVVLLVLCWRVGDLESKTGLDLPKTVVVEAEYSPITGAYQKITSLDSVQTLTVPAGAYRCLLWVEDDIVRFNDDGTDPDPSTQVGMELAVGQLFAYAGDLDAVELKGTASTIVHVWYYGL